MGWNGKNLGWFWEVGSAADISADSNLLRIAFAVQWEMGIALGRIPLLFLMLFPNQRML